MQQSNFSDNNRETNPSGEKMMIITGGGGGMKTEYCQTLNRATALDIFKLNCSGDNESRRENPIGDE